MVQVTPTRKEVAEALQNEIHKLGGFVVSVPGSDKMRFQFLSPCEGEIQKLRDLAFEPMLVSYGLRFHSNAAVPCATYELTLPADNRIPVADDRHHGEIGTREKSRETELMIEAIYGKQKRR